MADPEVRHRSMAHHLSYLLLSPAAIHLAFWPPDCGRFHPLHPLFAPNRVAQADHGMPENPKQHFCVPEECVEGVGTSPSTSKISPAPPTTSPSETAYDTALRSCLRRAELGVVFDRVINPGSSSIRACSSRFLSRIKSLIRVTNFKT